MLKAVVDEHGDGDSSSTSAFRLKGAYVNNPKRMEQLVETFPMSSVLKKVCVVPFSSPHPHARQRRPCTQKQQPTPEKMGERFPFCVIGTDNHKWYG